MLKLKHNDTGGLMTTKKTIMSRVAALFATAAFAVMSAAGLVASIAPPSSTAPIRDCTLVIEKNLL